MKILVLEPRKTPYTKEIDGSLQSMQEIVGGYIEVAYDSAIKDDAVIICNEEGKLIGLEENRIITNGRHMDVICGTCFVCNAPQDSEDFEGLSEEQLRYYYDLYLPYVIARW